MIGLVSGNSRAAPSNEWGLSQLMHTLAQVKSASAQFTERKTMHMLKAPLIQSGTLDYVAPDQVRKITTSPMRERFELDGNRVTLSGAGQQTHVFSLSDYPQIGGLVEGIRATLAGDLATLNRFYTVQLSGTPAHWQLLLLPKSAGLTKFIRQMRIDGRFNRIDQIDTVSTDGDHSEMSVVETVHAAD